MGGLSKATRNKIVAAGLVVAAGVGVGLAVAFAGSPARPIPVSLRPVAATDTPTTAADTTSTTVADPATTSTTAALAVTPDTTVPPATTSSTEAAAVTPDTTPTTTVQDAPTSSVPAPTTTTTVPAVTTVTVVCVVGGQTRMEVSNPSGQIQPVTVTGTWHPSPDNAAPFTRTFEGVSPQWATVNTPTYTPAQTFEYGVESGGTVGTPTSAACS